MKYSMRILDYPAILRPILDIIFRKFLSIKDFEQE